MTPVEFLHRVETRTGLETNGLGCVILYGNVHITHEPGQGWNLLSAMVTILVAFNTILNILVLILVITRVIHISYFCKSKIWFELCDHVIIPGNSLSSSSPSSLFSKVESFTPSWKWIDGFNH